MGNFLIALAVFLITVIGALFTIPYFIDWNSYRGVFEEEASVLLGREVRVGGAVNLHLLPTPYFRFEKVRIADTSASLQEPIFRADSLTVKLTIPPLLRGAVEANEIEFQRPILRLAVDNKGGWNWQSFGQTFAGVAYAPTNVALTSVKIADGVFAVDGADGTERMRIEGLDGEFSAPSLDGPYRFRGTYGKGAAEREIRIVTARPEPDGPIRFKASLRMAATGSTYTLDARAVDLMGTPRIDGELTARLPTAAIWQSASRGAAPQRKGVGVADVSPADPAFELKAVVKMDSAGAALSDLALSFEQDGRPQLVTGEVKARWSDTLNVDMTLSSTWLDLDRIAGAADRASPLESIIPLAARLHDWLPAEGRSRASFSVAQANIGGDAVNGVQLVLARTGDKLEVQELRLGMPGGSRGELQGAITGPAEARLFNGMLGLRGVSLVRFLTWVTGNALPADPKSDGAFGVRAQLSIASDRVAARDITGDLSGTAIYGSAQYAWSGRPELSLSLESPQLDARAFLPAGAGLSEAFDLLARGAASPLPEGQAPGSSKAAGWHAAQTDVSVRLNAGQLITSARTYRDVAVQAELKGGSLRLPLLRLASDQGFSLELEGKVESAASHPKGTVHAVVTIDTGRAVDPLAELLGIPVAYRLNEKRAEAIVPLRVAGSMSFGSRAPTSTDLTLDGEANGARVKINGRFDGSAEGWRKGPADLTALIESGNGGQIATLLAPRSGPAPTETGKPGRLLLRASGVPSEGLASLATVETGEVNLGFRGQLVAGEAGSKVAGAVEISASDGTRIAALAGLSPIRLDDLPIAGTFNLTAAADKIAIDGLSLKIAGSPIKGQIALSAAGERRHIDGRIDLGEISVAKLLSPLLDQRLAVTSAAEAALSGRQNPWPDEPFDAAIFDGFEGTLRINTPRLALVDGMSLTAAHLDVALNAGKIDVKRIEGTAFGGGFSAAVRLEKIPGFADVTGSLRIEDGKLEALVAAVGGSPSRASGSISGEISFSGKGTGPRNVIAALQGTGSLQLHDAKLSGLWPGAIGVAVDAALKTDPEKLPATLRQALIAGLSARPLPLPATVGMEIAEGKIRIKPFAVEMTEGRSIGTANVDLRSLAFESDWRLEGNPAAGSMPDKAALPAVPVFYRGPVASVATLEPRIVTEPLEREVAVRKMERDVEELERLRKLDEARRRSEAERLRRQFDPAPTVPQPMAPSEARPPTPG